MFRLVSAMSGCTCSRASMALALTLLVPGSPSAADETKNPSQAAGSNFPSVRKLIRTRMVETKQMFAANTPPESFIQNAEIQHQ
jgi:hypothetical protein